MAKLDLSALKKQKNANGNQLASVPASMAETPATLSEPVEAAAGMPQATVLPAAVAEPEIARPMEVPQKPKLSFASFKKPGSVPVASTVPVVSSTPVASPVAKEIAEPAVTSRPAEVLPRAAEAETVRAAEVIAEPKTAPAPMAIAETKPVIEEAPVPISPVEDKKVEDKKAAVASSEFFPNLEFENDNLFSDIMGMGSFGAEKEGKEEPTAVDSPAKAEEATPETVHAEPEIDETEIPVTLQTPENAPVSQESPASPESAARFSSEQVIAEAASKGEVTAIEPGTGEALAIPKATPATSVRPEYVETVAKDLSKERKGGLSELFDKKKKVFYGIAAMGISVGIVGTLYGFGFLDTNGGKASVTESPVIAVRTSPTPIIPLVPPSDAVVPPAAGSGTATGSALTAVPALTDAPAVAATGAVLPAVPVWTWAVPASDGTATPAAGSGVVLRKPTANVKRASTGSVTGSGSRLPAASSTGAVRPPTLAATGAVEPKTVTLPTAIGSGKTPGTGASVPLPTSTGSAVTPPVPAPKTSINPYLTPNVPKKKTGK